MMLIINTVISFTNIGLKHLKIIFKVLNINKHMMNHFECLPQDVQEYIINISIKDSYNVCMERINKHVQHNVNYLNNSATLRWPSGKTIMYFNCNETHTEPGVLQIVSPFSYCEMCQNAGAFVCTGCTSSLNRSCWMCGSTAHLTRRFGDSQFGYVCFKCPME